MNIIIVCVGLTEDKSTSVDVGKGGVNVGVDKGRHHSGGTNVNVGGNKGGGVNVDTPGGTHVGVGKGGVGVTTPGHHGKPPVSVGVHPGPSPFVYNYAAKDDQLNDNPNVALFFLEKDLHEGSNMKLKFVENGNGASFLPRQEADSIPFSSEKMPEILHKFSVDEDSEEGQIMKKTVRECEEPGILFPASIYVMLFDFDTRYEKKEIHF